MKLLHLKAERLGGGYFRAHMAYQVGWWLWRRQERVVGKVFAYERDRGIVVRVEALVNENEPQAASSWRAQRLLRRSLENIFTIHGTRDVDWTSTREIESSSTPTTF
jgi:hypothetical protein